MTFVAVLGIALLSAGMIWAAISDLMWFRIPNAIPILVATGFFPIALSLGWNASTILSHTLCGAAVLATCFLLFMRGYIGGGDAKLLASVALWTGWSGLYAYVFSVSVIGGIFALSMLGIRRLPLPAKIGRFAWVSQLYNEKKHIPYGVAIGGGVFAVLKDFPQFAILFDSAPS